MPPARVKRHIERRVIFPNGRDDKIDGIVEPFELNAEIRQLAVESDLKNPLRAGANGPGIQKR
jgi:hypothetical protein